MIRRGIGRGLVVACGLSASIALGGPPAKYFNQNTMAMVHLDLGSITVDNAKAAVNALVTQADLDAAGIPLNLETDVMPQVNQIGMMQMMTMGLTSNGADVVSVVVSQPEGTMDGEPQATILFPANSEQGAQQIMSFLNGFTGHMPGATVASEVSDGDSWVVLSPNGQGAASVAPSPERQAVLGVAMENLGRQTLSLGMIPTPQMVEKMMENVDDEQGKQMMALMMKADWMGMWLSMDETPEIGVRLKYENADDAGQVENIYNMAMQHMISTAKDADAQAEDVPEEFLPSVIASQLNGWLGMEREGDTCTITLDPSELKQLTMLSMKAGPFLQQNPMFGEMMKQFQNNMPMGN